MFYLRFAFLGFFIFHCSFAMAASTNTLSQEELAKRFATALNNQDLKTIAEIFDQQGFADKSSKLVSDNKIEQKQFANGFMRNDEIALLKNWYQQLFAVNGKAKYMHMLKMDGLDLPLVRLDMGDSGTEYFLLYTKKTKTGLQIVDFHSGAKGKTNSAAIADAVLIVMSPSDSIIERLLGSLGQRQSNTKLLETFKLVTALRQEGKFVEAYRALNSLPEETRNSRPIIDLGLTISISISEQDYLNELARLDKYHGDKDDTLFLLIDHQLVTGDFARAQKALNRLIEIYGKDAALMNLKATGAFMAGNFQRGASFAEEAIKLESDYENAYWTLVSNYISGLQYDKAILGLKDLSQEFGYEFSRSSFEQEAFYAEFVKSPVFDAWLPIQGE